MGGDTARVRIERREEVFAQHKEHPDGRIAQKHPELVEEVLLGGDVERVGGQNFFELIEDQHRIARRSRPSRAPLDVLGEALSGEVAHVAPEDVEHAFFEASHGAQGVAVDVEVAGRFLIDPSRAPNVEAFAQLWHEAGLHQRGLAGARGRMQYHDALGAEAIVERADFEIAAVKALTAFEGARSHEGIGAGQGRGGRCRRLRLHT